MADFPILEATLKIIDTTALVVGGGWALSKFFIRRESFPKIQFDLDCTFLAKQNDQWLIEIGLLIANLGLVRHEIDPEKFTVDVRFLLDSDELEEGDSKLNYQAVFPHLAAPSGQVKDKPEITILKAEKRMIVPKEWGSTFIDPGVSQRYSYVMVVPAKAVAVLVYSKFYYKELKSEFHTSQRAFSTPKSS